MFSLHLLTQKVGTVQKLLCISECTINKILLMTLSFIIKIHETRCKSWNRQVAEEKTIRDHAEQLFTKRKKFDVMKL